MVKELIQERQLKAEVCIKMTFTEWYEETYDEKWNSDYATFDIWKIAVRFEEYCNSKNIKPIWNIYSTE